jgi:hypothetical protein
MSRPDSRASYIYEHLRVRGARYLSSINPQTVSSASRNARLSTLIVAFILISVAAQALVAVLTRPAGIKNRQPVGTARVSAWDQDSRNTDHKLANRVIYPSAHADGTDLVARETFAA